MPTGRGGEPFPRVKEESISRHNEKNFVGRITPRALNSIAS